MINKIILFQNKIGFFHRYICSIWVPLLIPAIWYLLGLKSTNALAITIQMVAILGVTLYVLVSVYFQTKSYITLISIDSGLMTHITIHGVRSFKVIVTPLNEIEFVLETSGTSIWGVKKLCVYRKDKKLTQQHQIGKWKLNKMRDIIEHVNKIKKEN